MMSPADFSNSSSVTTTVVGTGPERTPMQSSVNAQSALTSR
jgi:hypothetical protein